MTLTDSDDRRAPYLGLALATAMAATLLQYGIGDYPVGGDSAYFLYLGQRVLGGDSIYANTFLGYPPMGPLLTGAVMGIGDGFDIPTYIAPRYAGLFLAWANAWLIFSIARHATDRTTAGILAGIVLSSFGWYGGFVVSSFEPKMMVMTLTLLTSVALQHRRPFAAGLCAALAPLCWQPAGIVALSALAVTLWSGRTALVKTLSLFAAGVVVALLPSVVYLTVESAWLDFANRLFGIHVQTQFGDVFTPLRWVRYSLRAYASERWFLIAGALGVLVFAIRSVTQWRHGSGETGWLAPKLGGMPLLALGWITYNSIDFQGYPDLLPALPIIAFFAAWLAATVVEIVSTLGARWARARLLSRLAATVLTLLAVPTAVYGLSDAFRFEPATTLETQIETIRELTDAGTVLAFGADAVYVLSEQRATFPFLRLSPVFDAHLHLVVPGGCVELFRQVVEISPAAIVVRAGTQGWCITSIAVKAEAAGYQKTVISWSKPMHGDRRDIARGEGKRIDWEIYRRPD